MGFGDIRFPFAKSFLTECEKRGMKALSRAFTSDILFLIPDDKIQWLRDKVNAILDSDERANALQIEKEIVTLLFACFEGFKIKESNRKYAELDTALDFFMNHYKLLSLSAFCADKGFSERTLRSQFQKNFKTSPQKFFKAIRLNYLYKALKTRQPEEPIYAVASRFGFWHMGQLARDFKALFGILPKEIVAMGQSENHAE
jgi:AraC family ethanolamine operon transcriptional activator